MEKIVIRGFMLRAFGQEDWQTFRKIRLEALQEEPFVFGGSYEKEASLPVSHWQERLSAENRHYAGLFTDTGECVGMTAIAGQDRIVELIASYIRKPYRGQGWAARFYEIRLRWARAHNYTSAVVSHREHNHPSQAAILRQKFRPTHIRERLWPDGVVANEVFYSLPL